MKLDLKKTLMAAVLASGTTFASMPAANAACGLECWLSNTFSTNDFVGDWLRETFGGINNEGSGGEDRITENLRIAAKDGSGAGKATFKEFNISNEIVSDWKSGGRIFDRETLAKAKPRCKLPELIKVVNETKSPEALMEKCF